ncbi:RNA polymerase sigma factor [Marinoscillum sp. MHG1-6]|uniref:RNA polymerase sigma factor n=1 Tax=Marinoscillum sp. MHG1-6 TaxID=2959627 RepID=UPI002158071F|nr:RNA polymerase sigma factor [Marinoscillum sp. MHG1-6]
MNTTSDHQQPSVCEERVFDAIHQEQAVPLRNFLYYKTGDLERACDLAQEAFARLWVNCAQVIFDKAKSFLFTTANRLFLDEVDHAKVVLKFQRRNDYQEEQIQTNPEFLYRQEEFKGILEEAISSLPEKQRVVFLLSRIDRMSYTEIAEHLDLNIKTVEKHVSSALKRLRDMLDELQHTKI